MQNKIKHIIIGIILCLTSFYAIAQADTIYIYEDIIVYDTIVIHDTVFIKPDINNFELLKPKSISLLQLDSTKNQANLLLISGGQAATFPINHIILDENFSKNINNSESMKKISFLGVVLFAFQSMVGQIEAQEISTPDNSKIKGFGVFLSTGISTQIHSYPNIMNYDNVQLSTVEGSRNFLSEEEYGKYAEGYLPIMGMGINYSIPIKPWLYFKPQVGYIQKGCSFRGKVLIEQTDSSTHIGVGGDEGEKFKYNNRFHYLTTDLLLTLKIRRWKTKPYFQTGLRNELLISYNIEYDIDHYSDNQVTFGLFETSHSNNTNYKGFNRFNLGMVNGFGLEFNERWFVEFNTNFDFGYLVRNTDLKVKNRISTLTVGIKL